MPRVRVSHDCLGCLADLIARNCPVVNRALIVLILVVLLLVGRI